MPDGNLNGWDELSLTDLFYAFRKAKVDCFYESSIRVSEKFIEYRSTKERNKIGHYHLEALGSFEPYFTPYRKWRDDGINTMKNSVTNGDSVVAITLDVGNFYRSSFQGNVDCVMILSWNKDIETFSSLVDSASFDVHAYIALVNNLRYGDSRVRRPAKQSHLRDVCRVRGGLNNQLVVVEIDPTRLRAQQSRSKRWPKRNDAYKPAPEGFVISDARKCVPD